MSDGDIEGVSRRAILGATGATVTAGAFALGTGTGAVSQGWRQKGYDSGRTYFYPEENVPTSDPVVEWQTTPADLSTDIRFTAGGRGYSNDAVVDLSNGSIVGRAGCEHVYPQGIAQTETYAGGVVLFNVAGIRLSEPDGNGAIYGISPQLYATDISDCEFRRRWTADSCQWFERRVILSNNRVYVSSDHECCVVSPDDGRLEQSFGYPVHALDDSYRYSNQSVEQPSEGTRLWAQKLVVYERASGNHVRTYKFHAEALFHAARSGVAYISNIDSENGSRMTFRAVEATSGERWSIDLRSTYDEATPFGTSPPESGTSSGRVRRGADYGYSGFRSGSVSNVVVGPETVYAVLGANVVVAIDATNGTVRWTRRFETSNPPWLVGTPNALVVCAQDLFCLDSSDGTNLWALSGAWVPRRALVHDGRLIVSGGGFRAVGQA